MVAHRFVGLTAAAIALSLTACGSEAEPPQYINASGNAFIFMPGNLRLEGGRVSVLERTDLRAVTGPEGDYRLEGLEAGTQATFVLTLDDYMETQTKTFTLGDEDLERVSLHVPHDVAVMYLAHHFDVQPDPERCQIATTITQVGLSLYDEVHHGVPGAVATIDPPLGPEHGPFFFDEATTPDLSLTETTIDGGVAFLNVPPGEYTLRAHKEGMTFEDIEVVCRPNVLTNASPPYGLQALE